MDPKITENVPGPHGMHDRLEFDPLKVEYLPGPHFSHLDPDVNPGAVENVPLLHKLHSDETFPEYFPAAQIKQPVLFSSGEYEPAVQDSQIEELLSAENFPAGHELHWTSGNEHINPTEICGDTQSSTYQPPS